MTDNPNEPNDSNMSRRRNKALAIIMAEMFRHVAALLDTMDDGDGDDNRWQVIDACFDRIAQMAPGERRRESSYLPQMRPGGRN